MSDTLISFETAKLAKEKGFNIPCEQRYLNNILERKLDSPSDADDEYTWYQHKLEVQNFRTGINAPTQSLLQKWLREVHNIFVVIKPDINIYNIETAQYWESISYINEKGKKGNYIKIVECETYEEALEQGLLYGLKLIE